MYLLDSFLLPSQLEQFLGLEFSKTSLLYNHYIYCFQMLDKTNMILQVPHNSRHYCDCELVNFLYSYIQAVAHPNNLSMEGIQRSFTNYITTMGDGWLMKCQKCIVDLIKWNCQPRGRGVKKFVNNPYPYTYK